jgi:RNA polymerase sigma-70 factor (ECF subfamily)
VTGFSASCNLGLLFYLGGFAPRVICGKSPVVSTRLNYKIGQGNDALLLQAIAGGEEIALSQLYDRYRLILFGLLVRILHSQSEAEEVLQEVFIQVWQRAGDFDEARGKPFTWLVTLTRSRAIDRLRALGARERATHEAIRNIPEAWSDAVTDAIHAERSRIVRNALARLPEEQRRALFLAYFEGLSQSEIAARLSTPLGTVKTRVRSGLIKLRELLEKQSEDLR